MQSLGTILVVCLLVFSTLGHGTVVAEATTSYQKDPVTTKNMTSMTGVEFHLVFESSSRRLMVNATNPTNNTQDTGVVVRADNVSLLKENLLLSPNEDWSTTVSLNSSLDALRTEHIVRASTYGSTRTFEFDHKIDPENSSVVPTPYIAQTEVSRASVNGEQSTVVNVTVVNPSNQQYPTKLMVHTEGTDGSFYAAIVPMGKSETVTVELLDTADSTIVGEARLYVDQFNQSDGGIDQVGFKGRVDSGTQMWNESYEAVEGPWSDDPYQYQNASVADSSVVEQAHKTREVGGVPLVILVAAIAALVVGFFVVRRLR